MDSLVSRYSGDKEVDSSQSNTLDKWSTQVSEKPKVAEVDLVRELDNFTEQRERKQSQDKSLQLIKPGTTGADLDLLRWSKAVDRDPNKMAEIYSYAESNILGPDAIEKRIDKLRKKKKLEEIDFKALKETNPVVYKMMQNQRNADLAHDQIGLLTETANVFRGFGGGAAQGTASAVSGTSSLVEMNEKNSNRLLDPKAQKIAKLNKLKNNADQSLRRHKDLSLSLYNASQSVDQFGAAIGVPEGQENFFNQVSGGLGQMGVQIGALMVNPAGGTVLLFTQGVDQQADRQRASGTYGDSDGALLTGGAVTAGLERIGLGQVMNRLPPKIKNQVLNKIADVAIAGGIEATEEVLEGIAQGIIEQQTTNPDADLTDGLLEEAKVAGGTGAVARLIVNAVSGKRAANDNRVRQESDNEAELAELTDTDQDRIDALNNFADSELSQSRGEPGKQVATEFLQSALNEDVVFVSDEYVQNNPEQQELFESLDLSLDGTDYAIPVGEYVALDSEQRANMRDYVRLNPDANTRTDIKETIPDLIEQAEQDAQIHQESREIWEQVASQLIDTQTMTSREAKLSAIVMSNYVATKAQREGLTPREVFNMSPLEIRGENTTPDGNLPDQDFGDLQISQEVEVAETGESVTLNQSAQKTWDRTIKKRNLAHKLRDCLNG